MEKITKEKTTSYVVYRAFDGEEFNTEEECKKYENSARGVISTKYADIPKVITNEYAMLSGFGSEDNVIEIVKVRDDNDINAILQMYIFHNYMNSSNVNCSRELEILNKCKEESIAVIVYRGYDDDSFWISGTYNKLYEGLDKIKEEITNLGKND